METTMTDFTLAGSDVGVRRVDFAGLVAELGDDAALDAIAATENGGVHRAPGTPVRLVRRFKSGDEALGFDYFARKAGVSPEERATPEGEPADDDKNDETNRNAPLEGEALAPSYQHLYTTFQQDPESVQLKRVTVRFSLTVPVSLAVRAPDEKAAREVVRRYITGEEFDTDTAILMSPVDILAAAARRLENAENLAEAEWSASTLRVEDVTKEEADKLLRRLLAEELRAYQETVVSNVDMLAAIFERGG